MGRRIHTAYAANPSKHDYRIVYLLILAANLFSAFFLELTVKTVNCFETVKNLSIRPQEQAVRDVGTFKGKIHFFVFTYKGSEPRVRNLIKSWDWVFTHPAVSGVTFLTLADDNLSATYHSVKVPPSYDDLVKLLARRSSRPRDLPIKDVFSMEYCVKNTSADWCYRALDDMYINREGFEEFVEKLAKMPDPREKPQVYGNCLRTMWSKMKWYLQGGSGFIFSRKAAELFSQSGRKWIMDLQSSVEDYHFTKFMEDTGITSKDTDSVHFTGHFMERVRNNEFKWKNTRWWDKFDWKSEKDFPLCPVHVPTPGNVSVCNHRLYPYHKVAFVHSYPRYMSPNEWNKWFKEMPNDAMFYYTSIHIFICKARPGQMEAAVQIPI